MQVWSFTVQIQKLRPYESIAPIVCGRRLFGYGIIVSSGPHETAGFWPDSHLDVASHNIDLFQRANISWVASAY